jgi:hypothetical protein
MHQDLLFETNRFNLSEVKDHFINPCCFGEDLAAWLRGKLLEKGLEVTAPDQEDWGWYIEADYEGCRYFIGVGGNADEAEGNKDQGEWRIMMETHRPVWKKLFGKDEVSEPDKFVNVIRGILDSEPDFKNVHFEQ